ncbi:MAG: recombinase family protein, partial [Clostridiales bacterium]|nr:recombinase family protein [Clostridiales bacterium]
MTVAFLQMAGTFAELKLQLIRARVKSGMANAKAKGKHTGRPVMSKDDLPALFLKYAPLYHQG